ncbi:BlaI/MecI/CopY family transcriptional regulator [candidate division KSB1 bacterium]
MARKKSQTLTDAELRLMNILWERGTGTVNDVLGELPKNQPLAYSTVLTFLRILENKGYIKHKKRGRAFVYYPIVDRKKARESVIKYVVSRFFNNSPGQLAVSLIESEKIESAELEKLKKLIKSK